MCRPRYASLGLSGPARTSAPNAVLVAQLTLAAGRTAADPASLALTAVTPDGGSAADVMTRVDAGTYAVAVVLPTEGSWVWTAAFADAGLSAMKTVVVDRTAPVVTAQVLTPPIRVDTGALTEVDPGAVGAFRRDERAKVRVTSSATDIGSVVVTLSSPDSGVVSFDGGTACAATGFCVDVDIDFAAPVMNAYRQSFAVAARAIDDVGNVGLEVDAGQPTVTRFKWSRALPTGPGVIFPAVDERGNVYISNPSTPAVASYGPDGTLRWQVNGFVLEYPPMLGTAQMDSLWLVGATDSRVLAPGDGGVLAAPWLSAGTTNVAVPVLAVTRSFNDSVPRETGFAVIEDPAKRPIGYRLGAVNPALVLGNSVAHVSTWPVFAQDKLWVRDDDGLNPYTLTSSGADALIKTSPRIQYADDVDERLAATATRLIRGGRGSSGRAEVSTFSLADGGLEWSASIPDGGALDELYSMTAGSGDAVFSVWDPGGVALEQLCRIAIGTQSWTCVTPVAGASTIGASLGEGGLLYIATPNGLEARRQSDLALVWSAPVASPQITHTLDCSRDGSGAKLARRPGVLYGQGSIGSARLFAVIVDSFGVDATAPWPLVRHDPRNTGNTATSLVPFSCP